MAIKDAAAVAGVHVNTASKWEAKRKKAKAEIALAEVEVGQVRKKQGGVQADQWKHAMDVADLPPVIPYDRLSPEAQRGWDDFDYFRKRYLGRVPSAWQVDAAYKIVKMLESPEKEFICINCPPGAGKSTLFHDFACWMIVRNRKIRVLIGSATQTLAKMYSRRIRETLERPFPLSPDPILVEKGLALNAEGCLSIDYGRFKPSSSGALWRAE
jgi:hypothetical protein